MARMTQAGSGGYDPAAAAATAAAAAGGSSAGPSVDIWGTGSQGQLPVITGGGNTVDNAGSIASEGHGGLDFQHGMGGSGVHGYTNPYQGSSINGLLADMYTMNQQDLLDLQAKLVRAGLLSETSVRWGQPDDATYSAYAAFLQRAQRQQTAEASSGQQVTPIQQILDQAASPAIDKNGNPLGPGDAQRQVINTTDPTALRETVQQAAGSIIGRTLSADQAQQFVDRITNAEIQSAKVTDGLDAGVDPGAEAQAYVKMLYPNLAKANNAVSLFNTAMQVFGINGG